MSECGCIYVGGYDRPEFFNTQLPTARKPHVCGECGKIIQTGELYEYTTGKWDGEFSKHFTCSVCVEIRDMFFCDGWFYGQIREALTAHILEFSGEISSDCITPLSEEARDVVCGLVDAYLEENPLESDIGGSDD